jgi:hypothetical protein
VLLGLFWGQKSECDTKESQLALERGVTGVTLEVIYCFSVPGFGLFHKLKIVQRMDKEIAREDVAPTHTSDLGTRSFDLLVEGHTCS